MLRSIQSRVAILVVAMFIPVTALIGFHLWNDWRAAQGEARQTALSSARLAAAYVDDQLGNLENLLSGVSRAVSPDANNRAANDAVLRQVKAELPDYVSNILLFALDGTNIGRSRTGDEGRISVADRDYFQQVVAGQRLAVGEPVHGRTTNQWISAVARPVLDSKGHLVAVIVVGIALEHFHDALQLRELPAGSAIQIVNSNGTVIARSSGQASVGTNIGSDPAVARHLALREASETVGWSDNVMRITGSSMAHRAPWLVSVGLPGDVGLATTRTRLGRGALFCAITFGLVFVIAWRISKGIAQPIWQLGSDAARLAAGELSHRTHISGPDEIRLLAQSFNQMAQSLERRAAESRRLAYYDQLTGLPNRLLLQKRLGRAMAGRNCPPTAVILMDLDGFKDVNDTLGHSVGDNLLIEVGQRLRNLVRDRNFQTEMFRLGGDEFILIEPDCGDPRQIAIVVDEMFRELAEPFTIGDHMISVGASAGIAISPQDGATVDELITNADLALYQAKSEGGRRSRFFVPTLRVKAQAQRRLNSELRRAAAENEFELHFQPEIRLSDRAIVGAEALLRWRHPEKGILAPGLFIDALAGSAIAPDVGRWIIRSACEQVAAWRESGLILPRIGVNLFPGQANDPELPQYIERVLQETGLPATTLELEITENAVLNDSDLVPLRTLRGKGVQLAFDDFGTGYASLSYLTRFPVTRIKIDRSFVAKVTERAEDATLVRSLISIAHNLGITVIAEGVETEAQAAFLLREGCEEGQGFLFARPLTPDDFHDYLETGLWREQEETMPLCRVRAL